MTAVPGAQPLPECCAPRRCAVHEQLDDIVEAGRQDGDKVKGAAVIDAYPGLGKSTIAQVFAGEFRQRQVSLYGPLTAAGLCVVDDVHFLDPRRCAIRTGTERLTRDLLDQVRNDSAAEAARRELLAAFDAGRLSTRPAASGAAGPGTLAGAG